MKRIFRLKIQLQQRAQEETAEGTEYIQVCAKFRFDVKKIWKRRTILD